VRGSSAPRAAPRARPHESCNACVVRAARGDGLLIDDHTFGTNAYGLNLVAFVGIDNDERAKVFGYESRGYSFVANESRETFQWLLRVLLSVAKRQPRVLFTDSIQPAHVHLPRLDVCGTMPSAVKHLTRASSHEPARGRTNEQRAESSVSCRFALGSHQLCDSRNH
jgi:hypothetical protein